MKKNLLYFVIVLFLVSCLQKKLNEDNFEVGLQNIANSNYNFAIYNFKKVVQIEPENAEAYNNIGVAFHGNKQYDSSIFYYSKAIKINPTYSEAYGNRGISKNDNRNYLGALIDYEMAISIDSNSVDFFNNRAFSYMLLEDYDKALLDLNHAIKLDSLCKKSVQNFITLNHKLNNYQETIEWCNYYTREFNFHVEVLRIELDCKNKIKEQ